MLKRVRDSRGDTIVEVLIATAIISLVLVVAYATTNRNTQTLQNTQELEQAQHLAETQVELLRANQGLTTNGDCFDTTTGAPTTHCSVASAAGYTETIGIPGGSLPSTCGSASSTSNTYTVCVYWTSLGSGSNSNVTLYYTPQ